MTTKLSHYVPLAESKYPIPTGLIAECGLLTVPESRSPASGNYPNNRTLQLYVTRVKSLNPHPAPDPVVFLYGGPGGNSGGILRCLGDPSFQKMFLSRGDLIVFDHRGSGYSTPALSAPALQSLSRGFFLEDLDLDERSQRYVQVALRERDRFVAGGINLAAINTPEIAADLEDLRLTFGLEQVNLCSVSYGTRPALAAMRDFPEGIRSVILNSTVPIQVNQYEEAIPNAQKSFDKLFDAVAADPQANTAHPNLRSVFYEVFERLSKNPLIIPAKHPNTDEPICLYLKADIFLGLLCHAFYSTQAIKRMPERIYAAYRGEMDILVEELLTMLDETPPPGPAWSAGMYFSVNCCDDKVCARTAEVINQWSREYPEMRSLPFTEFHLGAHIADLSAAWGARQAGPAEYKPVTSDIPTLILSGELDQNTPAAWGRLAGDTLANHHYVEFPGAGHGCMFDADAAPIIKAFWENPTFQLDDE